MKLLHVSSGEMYGGIETVLHSLARHEPLCPGLKQHFALCFEGRLADELRALNTPVYMLGNTRLKRPLSVRRARRELRSVIERSGCDFVICHGPRSMIFFAATVRSSGMALVMWVHGIRAHRRWLNRLAGRVRPDLQVCNSQYTMEEVTDVLPAARRTVVHYPLEVTGARPDDYQRTSLRQQFGAGSDDIVIVLVSRMTPWKGHRVLIDALASLGTEMPWKCWIVGGAQTGAEEKYADELKSQARHTNLSDNINFLGQQSDIFTILSAADIFCQPNLQPEPFGVAFIEAMAAGLPVVTSAMGAATELVDRNSGILVTADDSSALAGALRNLLTDPGLRQRLGSGGPDRARCLCDPAARLNELQATLASLHPRSKE